ncbi:WXG100 family type VII secretion target [Nocardia sp. NPDC051990]|uniref:WXG100 family type VII secretion target n=1 Tax=Nocardia sp. NPDC051990 TaxID=3155285 RepID=UPI003424548F
MSEELEVDPNRLRDASRFATGKAQVIREQLKQLDDTVGRELLADGWRGKAASAYDESWIEWKHGADEIVAALESTATNLADAANRYEFRDSANRDSITQFGGQV